LLRIVRAEDTRNWNSDLESLLANKEAAVRSRAALAGGRIGDDKAVPALITLLKNDKNESVRAMAAFALGEIESPAAAEPLINVLNSDGRDSPMIRSRVVEALGKIAASVPKSDDARAIPMRKAILDTLEFEAYRRSAYDDEAILLGITAALRAHPENAGKTVARFVRFSNPRIRMDAANTLARLKLNDGNPELRDHLTRDPDPLVRANSARVLGATEDKAAFEGLLDRAINDQDLRVRVSAIRALATLKDERAVRPLLERGRALLGITRQPKVGESGLRSELNEMNEIAAALGRLLTNSKDTLFIDWLLEVRQVAKLTAPEVEVAFARVDPQQYQNQANADLRSLSSAIPPVPSKNDLTVRALSSIAQGIAELAAVKSGDPSLDASVKIFSRDLLGQKVDCRTQVSSLEHVRPRPLRIKPGTLVSALCIPVPERAQPAFLRAYSAFKPSGAAETYRRYLQEKDVMVRTTAADLLSELPPDEAITESLIAALPRALADRDLNDAALTILDGLGKQKNARANEAIKTALNSSDFFVRRKAVELLKANGVGDFSARLGSVGTRNTIADYQRALSRIGKQVRATVNTSKGAFVIEFNPEEAPLTVDNFVMLARKGYFNGQAIPRVVPNFVIQTGDPRGDQNGGPGYSIRCEINQTPYDRGSVGMALSGKDTGGSQWFVTHSPQPHLDGGYTVFGRVVSGMNVVDNIVRGDTVRSIVITETLRAKTRKSR